MVTEINSFSFSNITSLPLATNHLIVTRSFICIIGLVWFLYLMAYQPSWII